MEAADLLRRVEHLEDRRARHIELTARGRETPAVVESIYREIEAEWARARSRVPRRWPFIIGRSELEAVRRDLMAALKATHGGELPALRPVW